MLIILFFMNIHYSSESNIYINTVKINNSLVNLKIGENAQWGLFLNEVII